MDREPGATSGLAHPDYISAGWPYLGELQAAHVNRAQVRWLPHTMVLQLEYSAQNQLSRPNKVYIVGQDNKGLPVEEGSLVHWEEHGI